MICRRLIPAALCCFAWLPLFAATTNDTATAEIEGRDLAKQLCELQPPESFTNSSTLIIQPARGKGQRQEIPLRTVTTVTGTSWLTIYETLSNTNARGGEKLLVTHNGTQPNHYTLAQIGSNGAIEAEQHARGGGAAPDNPTVGCPASAPATNPPLAELTMRPFAGSDFWLVDLGLEFLHWPGQKVLKKELKKGQSCAVLESKLPEPITNSYSRVVAWIDIDTGGIVQADAYDAKGKLLKEFEVKELEKVNGRMEVTEIQMRNVQTGSRTTLRFNFEKRK